MKAYHNHALKSIKTYTIDLGFYWEKLKQKLHVIFDTSRNLFEVFKEPIEIYDQKCDDKGVSPKKLIYENYKALE